MHDPTSDLLAPPAGGGGLRGKPPPIAMLMPSRPTRVKRARIYPCLCPPWQASLLAFVALE